MTRKIIDEQKFAACREHPEKAEIFRLEQLLLTTKLPYFFNFREDIAASPNAEIDWNSYFFCIEIGLPVSTKLSQMNIYFSNVGNRMLLEVLDMQPAENMRNPLPCNGISYSGLTAEQAMEHIKKFFETNNI